MERKIIFFEALGLMSDSEVRVIRSSRIESEKNEPAIISSPHKKCKSKERRLSFSSLSPFIYIYVSGAQYTAGEIGSSKCGCIDARGQRLIDRPCYKYVQYQAEAREFFPTPSPSFCLSS
uniref:Uncharacterized protein n=1 Tax=Trichogramma kaykai TaxID=54128 RepID=A0ABD2WRW2_9HYME